MAAAALAGALMTLVFCATAGAEPATTTSKPASPVTAHPAPKVVLIGSAESVSYSAIQSVSAQPVAQAAEPPAPELPHTGTTTLPLTLLGFALVLLGALARRGQHPQLRLAERS